MINKDFYPTPKNIIKKMLQPFEGDLLKKKYRDYWIPGKLWLEPSGGKGDIIDYLIKTDSRYSSTIIHTCEIEPDLQAILRSKERVQLVGDDFLQYDTPYRYDFIIMNPPFSAGIKHLLKAWELLDHGGHLICLLPKTNLINQYSAERTLVNQIIIDQTKKGLASIEDFGECFKDAERKTGVEVVCIRLQKEKYKGFEIDTSEMEKENFTMPEDPAKNQLEVRNVLENYANRYQASINAYKDLLTAWKKFNACAKLFGNTNYLEILGKGDFNQFVTTLNANAWTKVLNDMQDFNNYLTTKVKKQFLQKFQDQKNMAYTKKNMVALVEMLFLNQEKILNDCREEVFDLMTRYDIKNRVHVEGWKTNDNYKVNRKVILPNIISQGWNGKLEVRYGRGRDEIMDIDKAMCSIMEFKIEKIKTIYHTLENHLKENVAHTGALSNNEVESTFFKIRYFKKGTIHIYFKERFLWEEFNLIVCKHKGWIPEEVTQ